ncbi:GPCR family 2 secretin-like, partial [Trinorchestia longiramus]
YQGVYVVNFCPSNSFLEDVMRCELKVSSAEWYSPVIDIPVTSASSQHSLVYRNAFCARCHKQYKYRSRYGTILCSHPLKSRQVLSKMPYINGQKMWTGLLNTSDLLDWNNFEYMNVTCVLIPTSYDKIGRPCARGIVENCDHSTKCPKYLGVVADANGILYQNYECALCNGVHPNDIVCPTFPTLKDLTSPYREWHELLSMEMQPGDCSNSELLSDDKSFCTAVQCNPSLVNHTCDVEVIRIKLPKYAPSHISFYCLTMTYRIGNVTMLHNNHLYVNATGEEYRYGEYEVAEDGYVRVCRFSARWSSSMIISFRCLITLSSIALILHFLIFVALPKRRNTPSKNLCSLSIALFMSYILLSIVFYLTQNRALCVGVSVLLYYFLCSVCFWMNVLSIDICRTFRAKLFSIKSNRVFIHYSIYAWTVPLVFACIALSVDLLAPRNFSLRPEFGTLRCWFNNKWGFFVFYVLPSTIVMAVNLFLYIISVISIYQQHIAGSAAAMSVQKPQNSEANSLQLKETAENVAPDSLQHKPSGLKLLKCDSEVALGKFKDKMQKRIAAHRELKIRLLLYCKLALIMGMTWLISFIAIVLKSSMAEHIFIVMNGLQGTFIFIAFDCKQNIWQDLVNKF